MRNQAFLAAAFAAIVTFFCASPIEAQIEGGLISGTITDNTSAVIGTARVTIVNVQTQVTHEARVNSQGLYSVPNLVPGSYSVTASADGFKKVVRTNITLGVGAHLTVDFELPVGALSESVQVSSE